MTRASCVIAALLLVCAPALVSAQTGNTGSGNPSTNAETLPRLELSEAQKQTIYSSIVNLNMKNETPADFQPIAGAVVPSSVELEDLPKTLGELLPQARDFKVALISGRVVLVEPQSRKVVEAIAGQKS